jgi:hypothetical protein
VASCWSPLGSTDLPAAVPDADSLGGDAKLAGDLGLVDAGGEQLGCAQSAALEPVAFLLCRRATRDGWHAVSLTRRAVQRQPEPERPQPHTQDRLGQTTAVVDYPDMNIAYSCYTVPVERWYRRISCGC